MKNFIIIILGFVVFASCGKYRAQNEVYNVG